MLAKIINYNRIKKVHKIEIITSQNQLKAIKQEQDQTNQ